MPELPEVEALARFLTVQTAGSIVADVSLASLSALKTFSPSITDALGRHVAGVTRHGKFLDLATDDGLHVVWHLSRSGWVQWRDEVLTTPVKPGKGPLALRMSFVNDDGEPLGRIDITEAGTQKRLAVYVVTSLADVPGIARLGPDALGDELTLPVFAEILRNAGRAQIKGVLRDQSIIAGIGNAYSDEILHAARLSPYAPADSLTPAQVKSLHEAMQQTLTEATQRARSADLGKIKAEKHAGLRVHNRTGEPCDVCGTPIAQVRLADSAFQYCPTCQTGGKPLADRRMSRLLK